MSRTDTQHRSILALGSLAFANLAIWAWALFTFRHYPLALGTCLLAYGFGLRHALDADHIAAIDNVTRKLMQEGKRPVTVGLFFSLGHSTIVVLASLAIAATATAFKSKFDMLHSIGGVVGTAVSSLFLFAIAAMNLLILGDVWDRFQRARRGEFSAHATGPSHGHGHGHSHGHRHGHGHGHTHGGQTLSHDHLELAGGIFARLFRPLFRLMGRSWHMYPLGVLFGLGFDTASEIGLLGISASQAASGLPIWSIMVFPALFTAGMSLIDTADGILMLGSYGWAFMRPVRKLYYNLTITLISILVAVIVGGIEALGLLGDELDLKGRFWNDIGTLNDNFGDIGFVVVAVFIAAWIASMLVYRLRGYDRLDADLPS